MKTIFLLFFSLFSSTLQAKSFYVLTPQVGQGGTAVVRIDPYFQTRVQGSSVCVSVKWGGMNSPGKEYVPNRNGFVVIGVEADRKPDKYITILVVCGRDRMGWDYEEIKVLETDFEKTRTAPFTGKPKLRTGRQKDDVDKVFSKKNMAVFDLTDDSFYEDPMNLARDVMDPFGPIYGNNPHLFHTGVDLRAPVGTIVKAVNKGRVVLTAKRFSREGNMIIINHGLGIFSIYMHLSKFYVKEGAIVERGQMIGLSGKTGRGIREPHLHFNIRIQDTYVDPLKFIDIIDQHVK